MRYKFVFAGFGGQGIMLMGKLLVQAALASGKSVTWMPSYGAEVRGGTAHSMVVISDDEIASPVVFHPDVVVAMNQPSYVKFSRRIKKNGVMFINSSLAQDEGKSAASFKIVKIPASELAHKLGNVRCANVIMLAALVKKLKLVSSKILSDSLLEVLPAHHRDLLKLNRKALKEGEKLIK